MSNEHELPSDSDDSDEDYVPGGVDSAPGSEVESEGEAESGPQDGEDEGPDKSVRGSKGKGKGKKRARKNGTGSRKKARKGNEEIADREETDNGTGETEAEKKLSEEEEKKRADSLWADFMKDTPVASKPKPKNSQESRTVREVRKEPVEKVKITKLFEFAGEEVRVEKEVPADSAEARLTLPSSTDSKPDPKPFGGAGRARGIRSGGLGGISSVLGQLGKKAKISTLEKSKLDWDSYKREENIEEEISTHNKGKDGYLGKQDFLQRTDLRQFEIEKQLRTTKRSTR